MQKYFTIILLLFTLSLCSAMPASLSPADKAYLAKNYVEALRLYEGMEKKGMVSEQLFYNIGNCYYRQNNFPKAVLYFSRAVRLDPSDEDAQFNLKLSIAKVGGGVTKQPEMFFISWTRSLVKSQSANQWGTYAILVFCVLLLSVGLYIFAGKLVLRRVGLGIGVIALICTLALQTAAAYQNYTFENEIMAVVMKSTTLKTDLDNGKSGQHTLIPGVVVQIIDESPDGSVEVMMPDGTMGWTKGTNLERV